MLFTVSEATDTGAMRIGSITNSGSTSHAVQHMVELGCTMYVEYAEKRHQESIKFQLLEISLCVF